MLLPSPNSLRTWRGVLTPPLDGIIIICFIFMKFKLNSKQGRVFVYMSENSLGNTDIHKKMNYCQKFKFYKHFQVHIITYRLQLLDWKISKSNLYISLTFIFMTI